MRVRCALDVDAGEAVDLVCRSITELCVAEYRGDTQVLAGWLSHQSLKDFHRWIGSNDRLVCVAGRADGRLTGVGMVAWRGEILLNYVAPEARFLGVSKALMAHMEGYLRDRGIERVVLFSTHIARQFYCSLGYEEVGRRASQFGTLDIIEMAKRLE